MSRSLQVQELSTKEKSRWTLIFIHLADIFITSSLFINVHKQKQKLNEEIQRKRTIYILFLNRSYYKKCLCLWSWVFAEEVCLQLFPESCDSHSRSYARKPQVEFFISLDKSHYKWYYQHHKLLRKMNMNVRMSYLESQYLVRLGRSSWAAGTS